MTGDNSNDFANFVITLHTEKHRKEFSLKFLPSYRFSTGNLLCIISVLFYNWHSIFYCYCHRFSNFNLFNSFNFFDLWSFPLFFDFGTNMQFVFLEYPTSLTIPTICCLWWYTYWNQNNVLIILWFGLDYIRNEIFLS